MTDLPPYTNSPEQDRESDCKANPELTGHSRKERRERVFIFSHKASVQEIRLGALYRVGARRHLEKKTLVELMTQRTGLKRPQAEQLAAHWITTEPYRSERGPT